MHSYVPRTSYMPHTSTCSRSFRRDQRQRHHALAQLRDVDMWCRGTVDDPTAVACPWCCVFPPCLTPLFSLVASQLAEVQGPFSQMTLQHKKAAMKQTQVRKLRSDRQLCLKGRVLQMERIEELKVRQKEAALARDNKRRRLLDKLRKLYLVYVCVCACVLRAQCVLRDVACVYCDVICCSCLLRGVTCYLWLATVAPWCLCVSCRDTCPLVHSMVHVRMSLCAR